MKFQERAVAQRDSKQFMLDSIAFAFQKCPKLSNLIIECYGQNENALRKNEKQDRFRHEIQPVVAEDWLYFSRCCLDSMQFDIWDVLKPAHDIGRALDSLILLDTEITCGRKIPPTTIFHSLKHLRYRGNTSDFLPQIVACAPKLESIGIIGSSYSWETCKLQSLVGKSVLKHLRACSLNLLTPHENDLVAFLLRHSNTLQVLRIAKTNRAAYSINWKSFATQVRGQLPNLSRLEITGLKRVQQWNQQSGWVIRPIITGADILQDHGYDMETGPMNIEDGLWEDYEEMFFPDKCKP
jgi:hypothetical protein